MKRPWDNEASPRTDAFCDDNPGGGEWIYHARSQERRLRVAEGILQTLHKSGRLSGRSYMNIDAHLAAAREEDGE